MQYHLEFKLTEEDYMSFNYFHSFESPQGKKMVKRANTVYFSLLACFMAIVLMYNGLSYSSLVCFLVLALCSVFCMLRQETQQKRTMTRIMRRLQQGGKLPYDSGSVFTFEEDSFTETTEFEKSEISYRRIEKVCVVKERFVLLYVSSITAHVLPISQLKAQVDLNAFIQFLSEKCAKVEYY